MPEHFGEGAAALANSAPGPQQAAAEPMPTDELLVMRGIRKRWKRNPQPVLEGVDLTLYAGDMAWIGGRNGVGKTTLLRIAAGLIGPDVGEVAVQGLDPERQRKAFLKRVGLLSAGDRGLYARFSARQHLDWCARLALLPRADRRERVETALETFELTDFSDRRTDRLSLGQRQRLRLGMTLIHDPLLLMLDEPLNSLDDEGSALLLSVARSLTDRGGAVFWCSPPADQRHIDFDRRFLLENGHLLDA
jgi:ABC-2 type transport system ATP-binding protein